MSNSCNSKVSPCHLSNKHTFNADLQLLPKCKCVCVCVC